MNIFLCGLPKSGKTTLGKVLAKALHWNFIDTDRLIEAAYIADFGKPLSCREIFTLHGEAYFRKLERQQIFLLKEFKSQIIALGGGSLEDSENVKHLSSLGQIIYLRVSYETLLKRFQGGILPSYLDPSDVEGSIKKIITRRVPLFEKAADYCIEADNCAFERLFNLITRL